MSLKSKYSSFGGGNNESPFISNKSDFINQWTDSELYQINWPAEATNFNWGFYISASNGSARVDGNGYSVMFQSGGTAGSRVVAGIPGGGFEGLGVGNSSDWRSIDWTKKVFIGFSFSLIQKTSDGYCMLKISNSANDPGDITSTGLQIRIDNDSLKFGAHNNSVLSESSPITISNLQGQYDVKIIGDGNGLFSFYLDNVLIDTLSGPTAPLGFDNRIRGESYNGSDDANQTLWVSPIKIGLS